MNSGAGRAATFPSPYVAQCIGMQRFRSGEIQLRRIPMHWRVRVGGR